MCVCGEEVHTCSWSACLKDSRPRTNTIRTHILRKKEKTYTLALEARVWSIFGLIGIRREKKNRKKSEKKKKKVLAVGARVWRILGLIGTCDVWLVSMRHWNPLRASGDAFDIVNKYEALLKNQRHYQKKST